MPDVTVEAIRELRSQTGAGIMDCKRALEEADGDLNKASDLLKEKGMAQASKKAGRVALEGIVDSYIHQGNRVGALVELNCETDFVARTPEFRELAHDLAMQIAAMAPRYVDRDDASAKDGVNPEEVCLLEQSFIKDPSRTIKDLINDTIARVGENVRVRRFERFALGE